MYHIKIINEKEAAIYDDDKLNCILPLKEADIACRIKNEWAELEKKEEEKKDDTANE